MRLLTEKHLYGVSYKKQGVLKQKVFERRKDAMDFAMKVSVNGRLWYVIHSVYIRTPLGMFLDTLTAGKLLQIEFKVGKRVIKMGQVLIVAAVMIVGGILAKVAL